MLVFFLILIFVFIISFLFLVIFFLFLISFFLFSVFLFNIFSFTYNYDFRHTKRIETSTSNNQSQHDSLTNQHIRYNVSRVITAIDTNRALFTVCMI